MVAFNVWETFIASAKSVKLYGAAIPYSGNYFSF